ncbi:hypothetical protein ACQJBY_069474 [Aegilops geniculata]
MILGGSTCCCFTQLHPAAAARLRLPPARAANTSSEPAAARLRAVLEQVDDELRKGNDEAALSLVRGSQGEGGGLRCFGAARQTLGSIERNLQIAALLGGLSVSFAFELSQLQALLTFVGLLFVWSVDLLSRYITMEGRETWFLTQLLTVSARSTTTELLSMKLVTS